MKFTRTLRYQVPMIRGEDVLAVQQALMTLDVTPSCTSADGVFGPVTAASVQGFQHAYNLRDRGSSPALPESGEVGAATWTALFDRADAAGADIVVPCLSPKQVHQVRDWMAGNFEAIILAAISGTPIDATLVYAIACQETASSWLPWLGSMTSPQILARCVFDASGDAEGTTRNAFPTNTAAFRERMGDALTDMLIAEANATRALSKRLPAQWVYKGYGIFQYDLQNILDDREFFEQRQWRDFAICMDRFMWEMREKLAAAGGDLADAVRRYNGSGPRARDYAAAVMKMREWCTQSA